MHAHMVSHLERALLAVDEEAILGLDVPVRDAEAVHMLQRARHLHEQLGRLRVGQAEAAGRLQVPLQRSTAARLEHGVW